MEPAFVTSYLIIVAGTLLSPSLIVDSFGRERDLFSVQVRKWVIF